VDYFFGVKSQAVNVFEGKCKTALVACAVIVAALVFLKLGTCFVDSVVGQVHVQAVEIVLLRGLVLTSSESAKTFVVKIYSEGVYAAKHYVNSEVEFELVDQEGFVHVSLHYIVPVLFEVVQRPGEKNSLALARSLRLADESFASNLLSFVCGLFELFLEVAEVGRQQPGLGEKFVFFWVAL